MAVSHLHCDVLKSRLLRIDIGVAFRLRQMHPYGCLQMLQVPQNAFYLIHRNFRSPLLVNDSVCSAFHLQQESVTGNLYL